MDLFWCVWILIISQETWYTECSSNTIMVHWSPCTGDTGVQSTTKSKPPSALSQSTRLSDSLSRALVSCQSRLRRTNTPTQTFIKDVEPPSRLSDVSALWGIMRKIKHITSITPLTHFSEAPVNRCAEAFSQDFYDTRRRPETQLSFKFRLS